MIFTYLGLFLSLVTVFDLYIVLHNPFSNSEKRVRKYMLLSILLAIFLGSVSLDLTNSHKEWVAELNYWLLILVFWPAVGVAIIMMGLIIRRLRRKGMNKHIKNSIRKRYLEFVLLLSICAWWMQLVMKPSYRWEPKSNPA